jgi:tryptophan-rich sensory protein
MNVWYETLNRPLFTPPNWIFGHVWSVLYIMIAVSITLFFGMQKPGWALLDIIYLDLSLIFVIKHFGKRSRFLAGLLVPYLIWVLFATYLNAAFFILNKG